jgi:uncharacterized protein
MPVNPTFPGVYIEEIPSGVHTITGVATSITAFIGRAQRGPTDKAVTINSPADFERNFGGQTLDSLLASTVSDFYLNGGSQAIIVRLANGAAAATLNLPTGAAAPNDVLPLVAASPGTWGNNLSAQVDYSTKDPTNNNLFNLTIIEQNGSTEKFLNVSIDDTDPRYLPRVLRDNSQLVRVQRNSSNTDWVVPNVRPEATNPPTPASATPAPVAPTTASGGSDGNALAFNQFIGTDSGATMRANKTGLFSLEQADLFNILCIPPYTSTNDVDASVLTQAAKYCFDRRAILLIDPPSTWTTKDNAKNGLPSDIVQFVSGDPMGNSAIFFPRIKKPNPLRDNQIDEFVPCGAVAGVFARIDTQRGVWKAPAGLEAGLTGVPQLSVNLTNAENGELNPLGVNCLRNFPAVGNVVWGSRTLKGNDILTDEWKYIPVRRTALFIEESLYRGTQWVVFEPNDEPLWAQIRLNVGAFMQNLFRQGAFQGQSPRDAYLVKCDKETTTQNDINLGIVNIIVGFAPLKPAEFVILKIQQLAGQIQV